MSDAKVHVVDYGLGNLGSIMNMFRRIGVPAKLTSIPEELEQARRILLPGVGAFDSGMTLLQTRGFINILNKKVLEDRTPVLGICLGMQLLTRSSEEGTSAGLGWIDACTVDMRKIAGTGAMKFPHIGWSYLDENKEHAVSAKLPEDPRFYFVHTYMVECADNDNVLATTTYGDLTITAVIGERNIVGAQFHPEKSHKFGMQLLRNFSDWTPE